MSVKVSNWAWHEARNSDGNKVTGNRFILLLALADVADDAGYCKYATDGALSYDGLADKTGVAKRTIIRLVAELRDEGLIDHRPGKKGRSNEFKVLAPWVQPFGDKLAPNDDSPPEHSVTSQTDSVTSRAVSGDRSSTHSSIDVLNVRDVDTSDAAASDFSEDVVRLCRLLALLVSQNGHKVGEIGKVWWSACERLIRLDGYTVEQIEIIIRWATANEFWSANIRSMPKLREKFSTLRAQRNTELSKKQKTSTVQHGRSVDEILRARESEQLAVTA